MAEPLELVKDTTLYVPGVSPVQGGGSAAPALPNTAIPIADSILNTPAVEAQQARSLKNLNADISVRTAIGSAVRGTFVRKMASAIERSSTDFTGPVLSGSEKAEIGRAHV
jgi:hypothetical protein